jgi:hypothetical protein
MPRPRRVYDLALHNEMPGPGLLKCFDFLPHMPIGAVVPARLAWYGQAATTGDRGSGSMRRAKYGLSIAPVAPADAARTARAAHSGRLRQIARAGEPATRPDAIGGQ